MQNYRHVSLIVRTLDAIASEKPQFFVLVLSLWRCSYSISTINIEYEYDMMFKPLALNERVVANLFHGFI